MVLWGLVIYFIIGLLIGIYIVNEMDKSVGEKSENIEIQKLQRELEYEINGLERLVSNWKSVFYLLFMIFWVPILLNHVIKKVLNKDN